MNYEEVIEYMYGMLPMYQRIGSDAFKKDLTNTIALCEALNNPQDSFRSIHIAGTNGKGSTAHMMAAIMQKAGYRTGLYTSPHLKDFNERIKINGIPMDHDSVIEFVETNQSLIEEVRPSFFELTVAMAFYYFAVNRVEIAVVEVGLGGRLDSTNIISPMLSVITNISYDHQDMLGNTLAEIAFEKAGIIKRDTPVIIGESDRETNQVFEAKATEMHAPLYYADRAIAVFEQRLEIQNIILSVEGSKLVHELSVRNPALYMHRNIPAVIKSVEILNKSQQLTIKKDDVYFGISQFESLTGFRGRWQVLSKKPLIIADIGHNEAGLKANMLHLSKLKYRELIMVFGLVKDKELKKLISLLPVQAYYFICQPNVPRGLDSDVLFRELEDAGFNGEVIPNVNQAYKQAVLRANDEDVVFIGGSTFVVSELEDL